AGQTISDQFGSDGRLARRRADPNGPNATRVPARSPSKAPQFALVFLDNQDSIDPIENLADDYATKHGGTGVVDPGTLATGNGCGGAQEVFRIGGTSSGSQVYASSAQRSVF
ncbi:hypothetical protein FRC00_011791, partial [Tulasnella sp. 408]